METIKGTLPEIIAQISIAMSKAADLTKVYTCDLKLFRKKRSLDANAYYWLILGKYADWARVSKTRLHNEMLSAYGQELSIDGKTAFAVIPDNDLYKDMSDIHLKPTSELKEGIDGIWYRTFKILRGSHDYDSREMSILIDGLIQEIHGSGAPIQTMTPAELQQLKGYGYDLSEKETGNEKESA